MKRCIAYVSVLCMLFSMINLMSFSRNASAAVQATYYVSPTGSDSNPGTESQPYQTIAHAQSVVRTINSAMTGDIVVNLMGGTHRLASTLTFTSLDSGTNGYNVIYKNYNATAPIISGGTEITGWTLYDASKGIYRANFGTSKQTRQFYVDGVRAIRARTANGAGFGMTSAGVTIPAAYSDLATLGNVSDIEIVNKQSWMGKRFGFSSITGSTATMKEPGWTDATINGNSRGSISWVENAYKFLDAEGEWFHNRTDGYMYYKPRAGENMSTSTFVAADLETLINGAGTLNSPVTNIQFDGITFAYNTWLEPSGNNSYADFQGGVVYRNLNAPYTSHQWSTNQYKTPAGVTFKAAKNIVIKNNTFTHMGNAALSFEYGSQDNQIDNNLFTDISGNGINIGGVDVVDHHPTDARMIVKNNVVSNNTITKIGAEFMGNIGIFVGYTDGTVITHNKLYDLPYSGISVGWGWGFIDTLGTSVAKNNIIDHNLICNFNHTLNDGGGIYTLGSQPGSLVYNNYIYDDKNQYAFLYRDNGTSGFFDTNNVLSKQNSGTNNWYYTNVGSGGYWNANNNKAYYNYFSSGMASYMTGSLNNVVLNNTAVVNDAWDATAQAIIANAGVGLGDGPIPNFQIPGSVTPVLLSQGKSATASSNTVDASKAVDGSTSTRWTQASGAVQPSWLKVDLGANYSITSVNSDFYTPSTNGVKYKIEYSTDDTNYTMYANKIDNFKQASTDSRVAVTARYMKITFADTQGQDASINEFSVYGNPTIIPVETPISQGKTATASSIYSSAYNASKAVDGDTTTRWAQVSGGADPQWLKVDLGANYSITSTDTNFYMPAGLGMKYKIEYSTDDISYAMYADKTASFNNSGTDTNAGPITARYMRITLTGTQAQGSSLYEFKVYGSLIPIMPISQGKTATASSIYSSAYDASKAVDGNATTRWAQVSGGPDPSWLKVDLGANYSISSVSTTFYQFLGLGEKYKIEYSTDDSTYAMYADHTGSFTTQASNTDTNAGSITARYVKITLTATQAQGGSIYEFAVYGDPVAPLSQGKTATASSIYSSAYDASKAVDGNATTRWAQASGAADPSWLKVDLGANYSISSVSTTFYQYLGLGEKYKIEYSTDDSTYAMYVDHTGSFTTQASMTDTNPGAITARYMKITLTATQAQGGSIYEFKVFGSNIQAVNQVPITNNAEFNVLKNSPITAGLTASDADGDVLTYSIVSNGSKGTVAIVDSSKGTFTYTPNDGLAGTDKFTYRVSDGKAQSSEASVSINIGAAPETTDNAKMEWQRTAQIVTLSASDEGSGVQHTYYSLDNSPFLAGETVVVAEDGVHQINYYSVDNFGNKESVQSTIVRIDSVGPEIAEIVPTVSTNVYWTDGGSLMFDISDSLSGVSNESLELDGVQVSLPYTFSPLSLSVGDHVVKVKASDAAGNETEETYLLKVQMDIDHLDEAVHYAYSQGWITNKGIYNSLLAMIENPKALENHIRAQSGKSIDTTFATFLLKAIDFINQ